MLSINKVRGFAPGTFYQMPKASRILKVFAKASSNRQVTVTYEGDTTSGLRGGLTDDTEWQIQGYRSDYSFSVWIDSNELSTRLVTGRRITVDGEAMRILGVRPDTLNVLTRIDIGGTNAGN